MNFRPARNAEPETEKERSPLNSLLRSLFQLMQSLNEFNRQLTTHMLL
ncbi:MAG TPA: hypothetical protein V6D26_02035 [Stenomitos sp.]